MDRTRPPALSPWFAGDPIRLGPEAAAVTQVAEALGPALPRPPGVLALVPRVALIHALGAPGERLTLRFVRLPHGPRLVPGAGPVEAAVVLVASIAEAVRQGRAVYANMGEFVTYIFASNVPELVPFLAGIVAAQVGNVLACRTDRESVFRVGLSRNRLVLWGVAAEIGVLLVLVLVPPFPRVFGLAPPAFAEWGILVAFPPVAVPPADEGVAP